jgi:hypothetical protein
MRPWLLKLLTLLLNEPQNSEYGVSSQHVNAASNAKTITVIEQE